MKIRLTPKNKLTLLAFDGGVYLLAIHLFSWLRLGDYAWYFDSAGLWFITLSLLRCAHFVEMKFACYVSDSSA